MKLVGGTLPVGDHHGDLLPLGGPRARRRPRGSAPTERGPHLGPGRPGARGAARADAVATTLGPWRTASSRARSGGTTGSPRRGGRRSPGHRPGRPTCSSSSSTTWASRSSAASAPTSPPRPSTASPPAGCATRTSTPPRCARRPGPACSPAGTTTRVGMGRIVDLATGFPGYDARIPRSCALLPAMLTPHGYAAYAVGKWHLTPEDEEHLGARRDRWPLGRGLRAVLRLLPRRDPPVRARPRPRQPHVEPPAGVDDGYHLTTDLVDHAIEYLEDLRNVDVDKPWLLYLATGACHSPHQAPRPWIERYRGHFDAGWDAWREAALARQKAEGLLPEHTELSPRPGLGAGVGRPRPTSSGASTPATWRPSPGSSPTPTTSSAGSSTAWTRWASSTTPSSSCCPTTARRRRAGRSGRSTTPGCGTCCPAPSRRPTSGSTRSAAPASTTTTRGAGPSPATRRSGGGSARRTRAAWPTRSSSTGPPASRRGARCATSTCTPSTSLPTLLELIGIEAPDRGAGRRPAAARRRELRLHVRRRRRARAPHHPVLRDARLPGALRRRVEGGHLPGDPGRRAAPRRGAVGALRPARRPVGVPRPGRRASRSGSPR